MKPTDVEEFLTDLNAGVFTKQVGEAISRVAVGVVDHGRKGQVRITLDMTRIGEAENCQVMVKHKIDYAQPNLRGTTKIDSTTETPMHVTPNGVSLFDNAPVKQMFDKKDTPIRAVPTK